MTKRQSKWVVGISITLAIIVSIGAVGLLSKGFKNMDPEEWVDAEYRTLKINKDDFFASSGETGNKDASKLGWTELLGTYYSPDIEDATDYSIATLYTRAGDIATISDKYEMTISFDDITSDVLRAGFAVYSGSGKTTADEPDTFDTGYWFYLDYDQTYETIKFVCKQYGAGVDRGEIFASKAYTLEELDIGKYMKNIKLTVTQTVTTGSTQTGTYVVRVNDQLLLDDSSSQSTPVKSFTITGASNLNANFGLLVQGCGAAFKDVRYKN